MWSAALLQRCGLRRQSSGSPRACASYSDPSPSNPGWNYSFMAQCTLNSFAGKPLDTTYMTVFRLQASRLLGTRVTLVTRSRATRSSTPTASASSLRQAVHEQPAVGSLGISQPFVARRKPTLPLCFVIACSRKAMRASRLSTWEVNMIMIADVNRAEIFSLPRN
jgi:hypothetical protein